MFDPEAPPELAVTRWLNTSSPRSLEALRGKVVVVLAFQMLCEGCVKHALPQAARLAMSFNDGEVAVLGLHTVFENHKAQQPSALEAFMEQHGWPFPIGIDQQNGQGLPKTMSAYEMQGTPTLLLFDRQGRLRRHYLGHVDDVQTCAEEPIQHHVAGALVVTAARDEPRQHELAAEAESRRRRSGLPRVVRLYAADGHDGVVAARPRLAEQVLELSHLVAAEGDPGVTVLALGPDLNRSTQCRTQPRQRMNG